MFGLSVKEKLYRAIKTQTLEKLPSFEASFVNYISKSEKMDKEQKGEAFMSCVIEYTDNVSSVLASGLAKSITQKAMLAAQMPQMTGLPKEITMDYILSTSPFVGYYFAFYYYGITGKQISPDDNDKYITPLNHYQTDLISSVVDKYLVK